VLAIPLYHHLFDGLKQTGTSNEWQDKPDLKELIERFHKNITLNDRFEKLLD